MTRKLLDYKEPGIMSGRVLGGSSTSILKF